MTSCYKIPNGVPRTCVSSCDTCTVLTYAEIIALEPRIGAVVSELRPDRYNPYVPYEKAKRALMNLVGFYADNPRLCDVSAYDCVMVVVMRRLGI